MKSMFHKVVFAVLIVVLVLGITGGIAAASPSDNSVVAAIKSIVTDIQTKVNNIVSVQIPGIFANLASMQGWLNNIHDEVHMILDSEKPSWGYSGNFTVWPGCTTDTYVSPSPFEPEGPKHVVMTIDVSDFTPDPPNQVGQGVLVEATIGDNTSPVTIFACTDWWNYPESGFVTLDFVANDWSILSANCAQAPFEIYYSVVSTPADALGT
jgi:hypothetical protein